ncbi:hypothetical protein AYO20_03793 [Fonsecaea nubica]|uniref:Uncharacterized protein n=1 Tax=Fonsecaea nubica TaxID=856822 RepID=A0A178D6N9_9EURO|nr:hypothetical protein AYO20_03793 [Fonsecaea nubica]OAL37024.1 hypothetical protein AYO20_03793 [Fonsecaea nubica]
MPSGVHQLAVTVSGTLSETTSEKIEHHRQPAGHLNHHGAFQPRARLNFACITRLRPQQLQAGAQRDRTQRSLKLFADATTMAHVEGNHGTYWSWKCEPNEPEAESRPRSQKALQLEVVNHSGTGDKSMDCGEQDGKIHRPRTSLLAIELSEQ